jgi:hypothetical protein
LNYPVLCAIMLAMRPCLYCGSREKGQLNRHHLLPKECRRKGEPQFTVKLCRDQYGCRAHLKFHKGNKRVAKVIRHNMRKKHYNWLIEKMGKEWVDEVYPRTSG